MQAGGETPSQTSRAQVRQSECRQDPENVRRENGGKREVAQKEQERNVKRRVPRKRKEQNERNSSSGRKSRWW